MEQRSVIKLMKSTGATPTQCWNRMRPVFGAETFSKTAICKWFKEFDEGRVSVKDAARSGQPRTAQTAANIERVRQTVDTERRASIQEISKHLNMSETSVLLYI